MSDQPRTPVVRTNEPSTMHADGRLVTYYVDEDSVRWECTIGDDAIAHWRRAPKFAEEGLK